MKVLFFNHSFFNISETFIYKQIAGLPEGINASLMAFELMNENIFPLKYPKIRIRKYVNTADRYITAGFRKVLKLDLGLSIFDYFIVKRYLQRSRCDLLHAHFGSNALIVLTVAKALNIPLVVSFHGVDASPQFLKNKNYREKLPELFEYAKAIIVVSPHMIDTLALQKWKGKTHLIPYGVDASQFVNERIFMHDEKKVKILHSGRLVSKKGVPDLIRVFLSLAKKYPQIQLDIIGDGPELALSKKIAGEAGTANIIFHGPKTHDEVKKFMSETDIFVLNSRTSENGDMEGLPNAILEGMSMKLPVVSTYHAGISQAITNEKNGLLVDERDNEGLKSALEKLIISPSLRRQLGEAARHTVETDFTMQRMNESILKVYREVGGIGFEPMTSTMST